MASVYNATSSIVPFITSQVASPTSLCLIKQFLTLTHVLKKRISNTQTIPQLKTFRTKKISFQHYYYRSTLRQTISRFQNTSILIKYVYAIRVLGNKATYAWKDRTTRVKCMTPLIDIILTGFRTVKTWRKFCRILDQSASSAEM